MGLIHNYYKTFDAEDIILKSKQCTGESQSGTKSCECTIRGAFKMY